MKQLCYHCIKFRNISNYSKLYPYGHLALREYNPKSQNFKFGRSIFRFVWGGGGGVKLGFWGHPLP